MQPHYQLSLTPEQIAAISASGGFANCEDPTTHVQYQLIQVEVPSIDDNYVRQKIEEAYTENDVAPLDMSVIRAKLKRRLAFNC